MEKHGFIYIWYDRKRKMYYIGSHWGTEYDGYVCSSNRMRDAYRRRPHDFKRRIIQKGIRRENLLSEEYKWLKLISDGEHGTKYYNLKFHKPGHWSINEYNRMSVGKKISEARTGQPSKMKGKKTGHTPWNKGKSGYKVHTEESKAKLKDSTTKQWQTRDRTLSNETKTKLSIAHMNKTHSEETKKRMSEVHKKRCQSPERIEQLRNAARIRWNK